MKTRRIIYILEAYKSAHGGVANIYEHVEILADNGFNAFVCLPQKPVVDFYRSDAPLIIHGGNITIEKGDIFVIPEGILNYVNALRGMPCKRFMFCQNHYYLPFSDNPSLGISEFPVHEVIVSSETLRSFFQQVYGLPNLPLIPCAIDTDIFSNKGRKRRQIAYMPRKLRKESAFIKATFSRIYKEYAEIPWIAIDDVERLEVAKIMAESEIFLSLSDKDSLGLPPLEAMASGCLVAGFHGDGGREYMTQNNGWWAESGDWKACVNGIASALRLLESGGQQLEEMKRHIAATVEGYSRTRMKEELLKFWGQEIIKPYTYEIAGETVGIQTLPIIDSHLFQIDQDRGQKNRERSRRAHSTKHFYLLRGLFNTVRQFIQNK